MNIFVHPLAAFALVFFVILFGMITVGLLGAVAFALNKMVSLLNTVTEKLDPLIVKASDTIDTVNRVTVTVGEKADHILTRGETLTDSVSDKVEKTAGIVQTAVTTPLINLSSLITGLSRGFAAYSHNSTNGKATTYNDKE